MLPFRQLSVSKCSSSSFTGLKPWMDMFLTGVCLRGTLVILSIAENNRVMLSAEVRMRGRQGQQLCPGCWRCRYSCQLYETIHPPILCPDSPFELQNNDLTRLPTGKATSQRRTEGRRDREWGRKKKKRKKMMENVTEMDSEDWWRPTKFIWMGIDYSNSGKDSELNWMATNVKSIPQCSNTQHPQKIMRPFHLLMAIVTYRNNAWLFYFNKLTQKWADCKRFAVVTSEHLLTLVRLIVLWIMKWGRILIVNILLHWHRLKIVFFYSAQTFTLI